MNMSEWDINNDLVESVEAACVAEVYGRGVTGADELRLLPGARAGGGWENEPRHG